MNWPTAFVLVGTSAGVFGWMGWVVYLAVRYTNGPEDTEE